MIVKFEEMTFKHAAKTIFSNTSFIINDGITGVIGKNGSGKSSLLKIINKEYEIDSGTMTANDTYKSSYLNQEFISLDMLAFDYVKSKVTNTDEYEINKYLNKFDIQNITCNELSGGQRRKLDLTVLLLTNNDFVLLDEPTNHLDNEMIDFLITHIKKHLKNAIVISHDRYFLDQICNDMIYIKDLKVNVINGNYSHCIDVINQEIEYQKASDRKVSKKLVDAQKWMDQGPKARSTKSKHLIDNYNDLKSHKAYSEEVLTGFEFEMQRLGSKTININNLSFGYEEDLFIDFSYDFLKGDKIGIIGKNGCGKSTLLNLIVNDHKNITIGETVNIGYFSQHIDFLDRHIKVLDYVSDISKYIEFNKKTISALKFLELFSFDSSLHNSYIDDLSGGQKRRLALVTMLLKKPNVLVLDEPTNDFDTQTLELIESMLNEFMGIVIVVSHDRYFLNKITNKLFIFENNKINISESGLKKYKVKKIEKKQPKEIIKKEKKLKMSYNEKYEYQNIEQEISELENEIKLIDNLILNSDYKMIGELSEKRKKLSENLESKNQRWEYLYNLFVNL